MLTLSSKYELREGGRGKREEGKEGMMGGKMFFLPESQPFILHLPALCANAVYAVRPSSSSTQLPSPLQLEFCPLVFSDSAKCSSLLSALPSPFTVSLADLFSSSEEPGRQPPPGSRCSSPVPVPLLSLSQAFFFFFQITKPVDMLAKTTSRFPRNNHLAWCWSRSSTTDCSILRR